MLEKERGFAAFSTPPPFFFPFSFFPLPQTAFSGNFIPSDLVTLPTQAEKALQ